MRFSKCCNTNGKRFFNEMKGENGTASPSVTTFKRSIHWITRTPAPQVNKGLFRSYNSKDWTDQTDQQISFFLNLVNLKRREWQHRNVDTFTSYFKLSWIIIDRKIKIKKHILQCNPTYSSPRDFLIITDNHHR